MLDSDIWYETVYPKIQCGHTRVEMDASYTTALPTVSGEGPPLGSAPSLPSPRSMDTDPVYIEAVTVSGSRKVTQQPAIEGVVYDDIKAFQNTDVQCICQQLEYLGDNFFFISGAAIYNNW